MTRVFVNGSFDILHTGHLDLLYYAKSLGDILIVAIDTDERIRQKKGHDRPINNVITRKAMMQALKPVDAVITFDSDEDLRNKIRAYEPDIMVKGSDWRGGEIIGAEYCKQIKFFERVNGESTTKIIERITNR